MVKSFPSFDINHNQNLNKNFETRIPPDECHLQDNQVIKLRRYWGICNHDSKI